MLQGMFSIILVVWDITQSHRQKYGYTQGKVPEKYQTIYRN